MKWQDIVEDTPISQSSKWVNFKVTIEKLNGKLRICQDPSELIKATKQHHYHLPTTEKNLSKLFKGKVFYKIRC